MRDIDRLDLWDVGKIFVNKITKEKFKLCFLERRHCYFVSTKDMSAMKLSISMTKQALSWEE